MILLKSAAEMQLMRKAGAIVAAAHAALEPHIQPGVTTAELDKRVENLLRDAGATPSFKGYRGFPASICASVNEELVHGIPGRRKLAEGDIISVDIGACYQGYHGDSAWTYPVGKVTPEVNHLLEVTLRSLEAALAVALPGRHTGDIGAAVQEVVEAAKMAIVLEYAGHGVGSSLHEEPSIPNVGVPGEGILLRPGMVIAIEPMVNLGGRYVYTRTDGWTVATVDDSLCAHFEHTVAITETGCEILTRKGV